MNRHIDDKIKVVIFDHDDTLVGTIGPKWEEHKFIAKKYYNKLLTDEEIKKHWGKPLQELVCLLYGTDDTQTALDHNVAHHTEFEKGMFEATVPTLRKLKAKGKLIGIITATSRFSLEHDLKHHKVPLELIDFIQSSDETNYHKPDPKVFNPVIKWLNEKGIKNDEVLYIGDGLHDMKAALGAGFNFLGVQTGLISAEEFETSGAQSISSISELNF